MSERAAAFLTARGFQASVLGFPVTLGEATHNPHILIATGLCGLCRGGNVGRNSSGSIINPIYCSRVIYGPGLGAGGIKELLHGDVEGGLGFEGRRIQSNFSV